MKKLAYTIAEVMTTLTIVGVVAALVMPNFVGNYRRQVYAATLSNNISSFEVAMGKLISNSGRENLLSTETWRTIANNTLNSATADADILRFIGRMGEVLPLAYTGVKTVVNYYPNGIKDLDDSDINIASDNDLSSAVPFEAKNGTTYMLNLFHDTRDESDIMQDGGALTDRAGTVIIDINGKKSPNIMGRDIFKFALATDGTLYPYGGEDIRIFNGAANAGNDCVNDLNGEACANYLVENGFKMDY